MDAMTPRTVTSVLVEEGDGVVTVTWGLGEELGRASYFGFEVSYYAPDRNGGKRFGVKFADTTTAYVWDHADVNQSNYPGDAVAVLADSIVVTYVDAGIGLDQVGSIVGVAHIDGRDTQRDLPVTLLR